MDRLNQLIGQILALARMDSAVNLERKEVFDLTVMLQEIAADGEYEARVRHAAIKLDAPSECVIAGAPEMLRSAIENVVRNAIHHTAQGSTVEITLDGRCASERPRAIVSVRDYGLGVPQDFIPRIFEPFYRLPEDACGAANGSGLGLAIADRAVRLHGGRVTAANARGGGLLVTLELPRARSRQ
jgi:two-component system, OmpR family, sensor histidine kinase CpxA